MSDNSKIEKRAYGYSDKYSDFGRWLDMGVPYSMPKNKLVDVMRRADALAKKDDIALNFSPNRYEVGYDANTAIEKLLAAKQRTAGKIYFKDSRGDLPFYYSVQTKRPHLFKRLFGAKQSPLTEDNHPIFRAYDEVHETPSPVKKTASLVSRVFLSQISK